METLDKVRCRGFGHPGAASAVLGPAAPPCPHVADVLGLGASVGAVPDGWGAAIRTPGRTWGKECSF